MSNQGRDDMSGLEWLQLDNNLKRFCNALIANDGVIPKNNEQGQALILIMREIKEAIGNHESSDGCIELINNQLALSAMSISQLIAKDI